MGLLSAEADRRRARAVQLEAAAFQERRAQGGGLHSEAQHQKAGLWQAFKVILGMNTNMYHALS